MNFALLDTKAHDRADFDCGDETLNGYLRKFANQDIKRGLTSVWVLAEQRRIIGYYSLSAHSASRDHLPEAVRAGPYEDIPFLLLGRLAVDVRFQRRGYGDALIAHAFKTTRKLAAHVGIFGIIVDAKSDAAEQYYEGFGFIRLTGTKKRLVLPLSALDKVFPREDS